jgi:hypothetical protein
MEFRIRLNWIDIAVTGHAEGIGRASCGLDQAFQAEVMQCVQIQIFFYIVNGFMGSNELIL